MRKVAGHLDPVRDEIGVIAGDCCGSITLTGTLENATIFSLKVTTFFFGIEGCRFSVKGCSRVIEGFFEGCFLE